MRLRRVLPVAAILSALLAISACSDESTESADEKVSATGTPGVDDKAAAEAKRIGSVDPQTLEKATLSGKKNGFEVKKVANAEVEAGRGMKADKTECQPLASLAGGFTHIPAVSVEHRSLNPADAKNATVGSMWLAAHSEENAKQVMTDLRTSLKECPDGFKTLGLTYTAIQPVKAPKLGDESVAYQIASVVGKQKVPMTYSVVRSRGVIAAFYGVNMLDPKKAAIPQPVIEAQLKKIADVTG